MTHTNNTPARRVRAMLLWLVMLAAAAFPPSSAGQEAHAAAASPLAMLPEPPEPDDPAFTLYRRGYSAVLAERWDEARATFAELDRRYPGSRYADDAAYWTAFSWKQTDRERAARLYRQLLRNHPQSPYVDDAVADLRMLEVEAELARVRPRIMPPHTGESLIVVSEELQRLRREFDRQRELMEKTRQQEIMVFSERDTLIIRTPLPPPEGPPRAVMPITPEIRIRVEALRSLAERKPESEIYETLRDVALDKDQPAPLRLTAIHTLGRFAARDNGAVLLDVAQHDADVDLQRTAIETYAQALADKRRAMEGLTKLWQRFDTGETAPDARLGTTLYAIASIGDERATEFLATVARSHRNSNVRSTAVFFLGSIGTERARTALIKILKGE